MRFAGRVVAVAVLAAVVLVAGIVLLWGGSGMVDATADPDEPAVAWRQLGHVSDTLPGAVTATAVTDAGDLRAAWERHGFDEPVPEVDFAHAVVLLLGQVDDPCPDELVGLDVDQAADATSVLRLDWRGPAEGCTLATGRFVYAVQVHRGLLPERLRVEDEHDELEPVVLDLPPYAGPAPPPPDPGRTDAEREADIEAVFAGHTVRPCVRGANGWKDRDLSGLDQPAGVPTRTVTEVDVDVTDHWSEIDRHLRLAGSERSLEVVELIVVEPTRAGLDALAEVTDPRRVCLTVLPR